MTTSPSLYPGFARVVLDQFTPYDFKRHYNAAVMPRGWIAPTWVGTEARRLEAYKLIASYLLNASREYLKTEDENVRWNRREYGDPQLLVKTVVAAILGDDITFIVDGGEGVVLDWLNSWVKKDKVIRKFFAWEKNAVGYGDGVAVVSWDATKNRPTVTTYDPGFYFPDLDTVIGDYPTTVCIAYEFEETEADGTIYRYVRRIKYELVATEDPRLYPWNEGPVFETVLMTDCTWELPGLDSTDVQTFDTKNAVFEVNADGDPVNELDLGIDFMPIVHLPNTIADAEEHFGTSLLAYVLQILDDLQASDTDLGASAAIVGFPPIASDGPITEDDDTGSGKITSYGPGTVFDGKLSVLDTSHALDALIKYVDFLLKRLLTNIQIAPASVGAVNPKDISSGLELRLHFTSMDRMVKEMRLIREEKHPLIPKFAYRYAMLAGQVPASSVEPVFDVKPSSFVPSDIQAVVTMVAAGVVGRVMSIETGVALLIEAGVPVQDATAEVTAIHRQDFLNAMYLQKALGGVIEVYKYLGLPIPDDVLNPPPPDPNAPPPPANDLPLPVV